MPTKGFSKYTDFADVFLLKVAMKSLSTQVLSIMLSSK